MRNYILNRDHQVVPMPDIITWGRFMTSKEKIVKQQKLAGGYFLSTVFLGTDHSFDPDYKPTPVIFETMLFLPGTSSEVEMDRYCTWEQALEGHERIRQIFRKEYYPRIKIELLKNLLKSYL